MKHLFLLTTLLIMICMTACQKEEPQANYIPSTPEEVDALLSQEREAFLAEMQDLVYELETATLSEFNEILLSLGESLLTRDDFTEEEWEYLQLKETNNSPAEYRCTDPFILGIGDWSNNNVFSTTDYVQARNFKNAFGGAYYINDWMCSGGNGNCADPRARQFAKFSYYYQIGAQFPSPAKSGYYGWRVLNQLDINAARDVLLGVLPGC